MDSVHFKHPTDNTSLQENTLCYKEKLLLSSSKGYGLYLLLTLSN